MPALDAMPALLRTKLLIAAALLALWPAAFSAGKEPSYYSGPTSDHFDGERFFNPDGEQGTGGAQKAGMIQFIKLALGEEGYHNWPREIPVTPSVPPRRVEGEAMRVTWIGHATTLVQTQGLNILIDPVWANRDSPVQFAGPRRVRAPGVALRHLPPIDLILISHNHFDHLDIEALKWISRRDHPRIVVPLGNDTILRYHRLQSEAYDWGNRVPIKAGIDVILTRAHHWSARRTGDHDLALWTGFIVSMPGGNLYYSGDTGPGDMRWASEARAYGRTRFAILPIGPYKVSGPQSGNHIGPEQAVSAFRAIGAGYAVGVHWGTFELSDEPVDGPPTRLRAALGAQGVGVDRFRTLETGGYWDVPALVAGVDAPPPGRAPAGRAKARGD